MFFLAETIDHVLLSSSSLFGDPIAVGVGPSIPSNEVTLNTFFEKLLLFFSNCVDLIFLFIDIGGR